MAGDLLYLDSSALVKLVLEEKETAALREALSMWPKKLSSDLAAVEVLRAVGRHTQARELLESARRLLHSLSLMPISSAIVQKAATIQPPNLRSLDAIHLASALAAGPNLGAIAVYDRALADAASALEMPVLAPA